MKVQHATTTPLIILLLTFSSFVSNGQMFVSFSGPSANQTGIQVDANINLTFTENVDQTTIDNDTPGDFNDDNIRVYGSLSGRIEGVFSGGGTTSIVFDPTQNFKEGEKVIVYVTQAVQSTTATAVLPSFLEFRVGGAPATGDFPALNAITGTTTFITSDIELGDLDNDGILDLVTATSEGVYVAFGNGSGDFEPGTQETTVAAAFVELADFNQDGFTDMVVATESGNPYTIDIYLNDGVADPRIFPGSPTSTVSNAAGGINLFNGLGVGDFTRDGVPDVIAGQLVSAANAVEIYSVNGATGTFLSTASSAFGNINASDFVIGDFDNSGTQDYIMPLSAGSSTVNFNNSTGVGDPLFSTVSSGISIQYCKAADFDGNGFLDLAYFQGGFLQVRPGDGSGDFTAGGYSIGNDSERLAIGDVNGDGLLDIMTVGNLGTRRVYFNQGAFTFTQQILSSLTFMSDVELGDLNADGILDAVYANSNTSAPNRVSLGEAPPALITVTSDADAGAGSLRQAIADVAQGGTIQFDPTLDGAAIRLSSILLVQKDLTFDGQGQNIILSGDTDDSGTSNIGDTQIMSVDEGFTVSFSSITFEFGFVNGDLGGALLINAGSNVSISECTFRRNTASGVGGAAAAIAVGLANVNIDRCVFEDNTAFEGGGAIYQVANDGSNNITNIYNSSFINNQVGNTAGFGGAIAMAGGSSGTNTLNATIYNCTFYLNSAGGQGGALLLGNLSSTPTSTHTFTLSNNTFFNNNSTSSNQGDDIYVGAQGDLSLYNTLIANDESTAVVVDALGAISASSNNLIAQQPSTFGAINTGNLLTTEILNTSLVTGINGIPVLEIIPEGPAYDAGTNTQILPDVLDVDDDLNTVEDTPIDAAGNPRAWDPATSGAGTVDIGATESQIAPAPFITTWNTSNTGPGTTSATEILIPLEPSTVYDFTVDWGDGSGTESFSGLGGSLNPTHDYTSTGGAGIYTISITGTFPRIYFNGGGDAIKLISVDQWGAIVWGPFLDNAFNGCTNLNLVASTANGQDDPDLSAVLDAGRMFFNCSSFNNDISSWNVSSIQLFTGMFEGATLFNSPLNAWTVDSGQNMSGMFANTAFNQPLNSWGVESVQDMSNMFFNAPFNQDITGWTPGAVQNFSSMFEGNTFFNQAIGLWGSTGAATNMSRMFFGATAFNQDLSAWDVSTVTNFSQMFEGATGFNNGQTAGQSTAPLNWTMATSATNLAMMFRGASIFNQSINSWTVTNVTFMDQMFQNATDYNQPLNLWNTGLVQNFGEMFAGAISFDQDISSWNLTSAANLGGMFSFASSFNQPLDVWGGTKPANAGMVNLFESAVLFNQPLSSWNVSGVTDMFGVFKNATAFNQDLSSWDVTAVTSAGGSMGEMLDNSGMSVANYEATLVGWAGQAVQTGVTLGANGLSYTSAIAAERSTLEVTNSWTISGDIDVTPALAPTDFIAYESGGNIVLEWLDNATDETGFLIERADDYAFTTNIQDITVAAGSPGIDATTATYDPLGVDYYYRVTAVNGFEDASSRTNVEFASPNPFPGQALSFDGSNDYVDVGQLDLGNVFTVEAWFNTISAAETIILRKSGPSSGTYSLFMNGGNVIFRVAQAGGSNNDITSSSTLNDGTWHHVAGTFDGTTMTLYIDGQDDGMLVPSPTVSTTDGTDPLFIGAENNLTRFFNGQIDEVRVWNDVRLEAEIQANLYNNLLGNEANLEAYYPLDEGAGATNAVDRSVNLADGLLNGGITSEVSGVPSGPIMSLTTPTPTSNEINQNAAVNITVRYSADIDINTVTNGTIGSTQTGDDGIKVIGSLSGIIEGTWADVSGDAIFTPAINFLPGELVTVTITDAVGGTTGEIVVPESYQFTIETNAGPGSFSPGNVVSNIADGAQSVYAFDIDQDGDMDMLSASEEDDKIAWYENDGAQNFAEQVISTAADGAYSVFAVDVDSDGDIDVLSASFNDNKIAWYENNGSQSFTERVVATDINQAIDVRAIDMDSDGDMDILGVSFLDGKISIFTNDGAQNFTEEIVTSVLNDARSVYPVDIDEDGDLDLVSASGTAGVGDDISWYENDGQGSFTKILISTSITGGRSIFAIDVDGDFDVDVLSASYQDDKVAWYENDGSQNFTQRVITTNANFVSSVYAADIDGDNDIDVLSASQFDNKVAWYENDGTENFTEQVITTSASLATSALAVDMDNDGDLDVISSSQNDEIAWYEQTTLPPAAPSNFIAYESGGNIVMEWFDNATDETGFLIERADDYAFTLNVMDITSAAGNPGIDATTATYDPSGVDYYYRVTAVNGFEDATSRSNVEFASPNPFPGQSLSFDGTDDFVSISNSGSLNLINDFAVEFWFRQTTPVSALNNHLFYVGSIGGEGVGIFIDVTNGNRLGLSSGNTTSNTAQFASGPLEEDRWYHVALSVDAGGTADVYLDGVIDAGIFTIPIAYAATPDLVIGDLYTGQIEEFKVWDFAKTNFSDRFNSLQGNEANLLAYYPFDEGIGATNTVDRSANTNDGLLNGGVASLISDFTDSPAISNAIFSDTNGDGNLDQVRLVFDRAVDVNDVGGAGDGLDVITLNDGGPITLDNADYSASGVTQLDLNFLGNQITGTSVTGITLSYTHAGASEIVNAGSAIEIADAATPAAFTDNAAPVVVSLEIFDQSGEDGRIDRIDITFSENIDTDDSAAPVLGDFGTLLLPDGTALASGTYSDPDGVANVVSITVISDQLTSNTAVGSTSIDGIDGLWRDANPGNLLTATGDDFEVIIDSAPATPVGGIILDSDQDGLIDAAEIQYSEPITDLGVTPGDFTISTDAGLTVDPFDGFSTAVNALTTDTDSDDEFITLSLAGHVNVSGTGPALVSYTSTTAILDVVGNPAPNFTDAAPQDGAVPIALRFSRLTPLQELTNADNLTFQVEFSEDVTGTVQAADFAVVGTSATVTGTTPVSGSVYDVTLGGGNLAIMNGVVGLDLNAGATINDAAINNILLAEPPVDETYTIDNEIAIISSISPATNSFVTNTDLGYTLSEELASGTATFTRNSGTADPSSPHVVTLAGAELASGSFGPAALTNAPSLVDGAVYNITIVGVDLAGNTSADGTVTNITFDVSVPTLVSFTRQTPAAAVTNADALVFRAIFSEDVQGVDAADFSVNASTATITNVAAIDAQTYDITVSGGNLATFEGVVGLDLVGGILDLAGNSIFVLEPGTDETYTLDNTDPTVVLSSLEPDPTGAPNFILDVVFSEAVTGLLDGDFAVGNGAASGLTGSGTTYSITITPTADGLVTVDLPAASAQDGAGNDNIAATQFSITYDATDPTVVLSSLEPDPTGAPNFILDVVFSESVTGLLDGDFAVGNGAASGLTGAGTTYSITITPAADGLVTVDLPAASAQDGAGNDNIAATQFSITYDATDPTVVLSSLEPDPTGAPNFILDVVFSEAVTGLLDGDFAVGNGAASGLTGSGTTYSITITPAADGLVTVDLPAASAQDGAGNDNIAATQFSITYDGSAPVTNSFVRQSPLAALTNADILIFRVSFNEDVTGVDVADFAVDGTTTATITSVTPIDGSTYDVQVSGGDLAGFDGIVGLNYNTGSVSIQDLSGNALPDTEPATDETYTLDNSSFSASIVRQIPLTEVVNVTSVTFRVTFSEDVVNVDVADFVSSLGTVNSVTPNTPSEYDVAIIGISGDGLVDLDFSGGQDVQDLTTNPFLGTIGVEETYTNDATDPTVVLSSLEPDPTGAPNFILDVVFSEPVTGLLDGDFAVGNGAASGLTGSGTTYSITITPTADGLVTVDLPAASAQDGAGNDNIAATQFSITYDATDPTVVLSSLEPDPTGAPNFILDVVFSEAVTGLLDGDFAVGNGAASGLTGSGTTYSITITPTADGLVTVDLPAASAQDGAGNDNIAATQFSITYDGSAPVTNSFVRQSPLAALTNADILIFRVSFNEDVTGVDVADFAVDGTTTATITSVTPIDGSTYDVQVSGGDLAGFDGIVGLNYNTGSVSIQDLSGNALPDAEPATDETYTVNNTSFTATIARLVPITEFTNAGSVTLRVTFSEDVFNVDIADFTTTIGSITNVAQISAFEYDVTADGVTGDGLLDLDFSGGQDIVNAISNPFAGTIISEETYTIDNTAPTVTLSSIEPDPTSSVDFVLDIIFSEIVIGLTEGDFVIANGAVSGLIGSGNTYSITVTPAANGLVTVDLPAAAAQDLASNASEAAVQFIITNDQPVPNVAISSADTDPTNANPIVVNIAFTEDVIGFDISDIVVGNGTIATFFTTDASNYIIDVIPAADGIVTVDISGGVAQDIDGNDNLPAAQFTIAYDATAPVVGVDVFGTSISSPQLTGTIDDNGASIAVNVAGNSYAAVNNGDGTWTLAAGIITPGLTDGTYDVIVTATDLVGNAGTDNTIDELTISQTVVTLFAGNVTSTGFTARWSEGLDVQTYQVDVSAEADFSSFLTGFQSSETTETSIEVTGLDFSSQYYYRVRLVNTSDEVSGNSNATLVKTAIDPETVADSTALTQIYGAINPQGLNWETARLRNWSGISLDAASRTRVEVVDISGTNSIGDMPSGFTGVATDGLSAMITMNASVNQLTGLIDFTGTAITDLNVSSNNLEFDDLEPIVGINTVDYSNQASIPFSESTGGDQIEVRFMNDFSLSISIDGSDNAYTWYRNDVEIGTTENEFIINDRIGVILGIDFDNMGTFRAEVTNSLVPGLIIDIDPQDVFAVVDVTVRLIDGNDGILAGETFDGALLEAIRREQGYDTLERATNVEAEFVFNDVVLGDYLCGIEPDNTDDFIPTYFTNAFQWDEADTLLLRKDTTLSIQMTADPPELTEEDGEGSLEVVIEEDFGDDAARVDARRRASKRKCGLRRKRTGGRTSQDDEFVLIAYGETDENGEFKFGFLPTGTYRFFVEYPGIPINESSFVEFEVGEAGVSDKDFKLQAFASEDGIEVEIEAVLGIILEYFKDLEIYPNPSSDYLNVRYRHLKSRDVTAQLVDLNGNTRWTQELRNGFDGEIRIDVTDFREGIYFLRFYDRSSPEDNVVTFRVFVKK